MLAASIVAVDPSSKGRAEEGKQANSAPRTERKKNEGERKRKKERKKETRKEVKATQGHQPLFSYTKALYFFSFALSNERTSERAAFAYKKKKKPPCCATS